MTTETVKRIPFEASKAEVFMLETIKTELSAALGRHYKLSTADCISFALARFYELTQEADSYDELYPYTHNLEETRLKRLLD